MWLLSFDPQQVSTALQAGDTVQNHSIFTRARFELEQAALQTLRLHQLAVCFDYNVTVSDVVSAVDNVAVEE